MELIDAKYIGVTPDKDIRFLQNLFNRYPTGKLISRLEGKIFAEVIHAILPNETTGSLLLHRVIDTIDNIFHESSFIDISSFDAQEPYYSIEWEFLRPDGSLVNIKHKDVYYTEDVSKPMTLIS